MDFWMAVVNENTQLILETFAWNEMEGCNTFLKEKKYLQVYGVGEW